MLLSSFFSFFFFNDSATPEIYTSFPTRRSSDLCFLADGAPATLSPWARRSSPLQDRKSTRLNSSHSQISYAVFCLKKKKKKKKKLHTTEILPTIVRTTASRSAVCSACLWTYNYL